ncbi:MAG: phosphatidylinositol kinase [Cytophagales bacterium]|nr:MAG: phosphatidylinositol kinase [Cytophagales bacterium]
MNRRADVYLYDDLAGYLVETDEGYQFQYDQRFLQQPRAEPVSLTLPLTEQPYQSTILFPFFDGLIPEGWLLDIAEQNWKIRRRDRFGLLLACCRDCIGAVSIVPKPLP